MLMKLQLQQPLLVSIQLHVIEAAILSVELCITVDREIFIVKDFHQQTLPTKIKHAKYLCNVHRPIPILVAKVWQRNLDYAKNLQAKNFTGENISIYGVYIMYMHV